MDLIRLKPGWIALTLLLAAGCARFEPRPLLPSETAAKWEARTLEDPGFKVTPGLIEQTQRLPATQEKKP